eukprot:g3102.t1
MKLSEAHKLEILPGSSPRFFSLFVPPVESTSALDDTGKVQDDRPKGWSFHQEDNDGEINIVTLSTMYNKNPKTKATKTINKSGEDYKSIWERDYFFSKGVHLEVEREVVLSSNSSTDRTSTVYGKRDYKTQPYHGDGHDGSSDTLNTYGVQAQLTEEQLQEELERLKRMEVEKDEKLLLQGRENLVNLMRNRPLNRKVGVTNDSDRIGQTLNRIQSKKKKGKRKGVSTKTSHDSMTEPDITEPVALALHFKELLETHRYHSVQQQEPNVTSNSFTKSTGPKTVTEVSNGSPPSRIRAGNDSKRKENGKGQSRVNHNHIPEELMFDAKQTSLLIENLIEGTRRQQEHEALIEVNRQKREKTRQEFQERKQMLLDMQESLKRTATRWEEYHMSPQRSLRRSGSQPEVQDFPPNDIDLPWKPSWKPVTNTDTSFNQDIVHFHTKKRPNDYGIGGYLITGPSSADPRESMDSSISEITDNVKSTMPEEQLIMLPKPRRPPSMTSTFQRKVFRTRKIKPQQPKKRTYKKRQKKTKKKKRGPPSLPFSRLGNH